MFTVRFQDRHGEAVAAEVGPDPLAWDAGRYIGFNSAEDVALLE
jgi:hypothetical protein